MVSMDTVSKTCIFCDDGEVEEIIKIEYFKKKIYVLKDVKITKCKRCYREYLTIVQANERFQKYYIQAKKEWTWDYKQKKWINYLLGNID